MKRYDINEANRQVLRYEGPLAEYFREQEEKLVFAGLDFHNKVVLDLGCGIGRMERLLPSMGARRVIACDLSESMLRVGANRASHCDVIYAVMDARRLALPSQSVDIVLSLGMFEGIDNISPFVKEVSRVLRPGGIFVFTCWNFSRWYKFRFLDGRRPGSVEHNEKELRMLLQDESFSFRYCDSYLFLPRYLFWGIYHTLVFNSFRKAYVTACNCAAKHIRNLSMFRYKGWVLLVKAHKFES